MNTNKTWTLSSELLDLVNSESKKMTAGLDN